MEAILGAVESFHDKGFFYWPSHGFGGSIQSRVLGARAPRLPGFILLVSFSDTLLAVSILGIVYDCHLRPFL